LETAVLQGALTFGNPFQGSGVEGGGVGWLAPMHDTPAHKLLRSHVNPTTL